MSGSGDRRLGISQETANHIKNSERVAQLRNQLNDTSIRSPFEGLEMTEVMPERPEADTSTQAAQDDLSILTPATRGEFAKEHLAMDINAPRPVAGNVPIFDGATQVAGAGLTFEEFASLSPTDADLGKLIGGAGRPEG